MAIWLLFFFALALALPVLSVLGAWLALDATAWAQWQHLLDTVLPGYAAQTALLALGVGLGTLVVGGASAALVSLFEFRGRRFWDVALLLPMAMPAYVAAYAYTDALQFSGPLQTALRETYGWQGALWGDVRSLPGAVVLFVACLYPYVYLLTRTALAERAAPLMEAARLLGASLPRRVLEVAMPLARPALAAGVMLALMETLADYGVGSYFGLSTLSTGIYKAWLVQNDRFAAAQLASVLLAVVVLCLVAERRAQARLRFAQVRAAAPGGGRQPLHGAFALLAHLLLAVPLLLGFVLPVLVLLRMVWLEAKYGELEQPWVRFFDAAGNSLQLALLGALLTLLVALLLSAAQRLSPGRGGVRQRAVAAANALVGLGYAVPGAVIAIGLLLPLVWLRDFWPGLTVWITGTVAGLLMAYMVRFSGVALQTVQSGYARVPLTLDDSARLLGLTGGRLWWSVHRPLLQRSALAAALLVFVDVMKELPATLVLRPFDSDTLAVSAYQLARDERLAEAALPALAIVLVGLLPVLLLWRAMRLR
ncbi:MAG: iron ABC transporter permease [Burkholderiales bacterium]|nr:iron ABC transporter permease [Burkholderiales bacterium]